MVGMIKDSMTCNVIYNTQWASSTACTKQFLLWGLRPPSCQECLVEDKDKYSNKYKIYTNKQKSTTLCYWTLLTVGCRTYVPQRCMYISM